MLARCEIDHKVLFLKYVRLKILIIEKYLEWTKLALELSIEANARRTAAERILSELAEEEAPKHNKKKEKAKMQD